MGSASDRRKPEGQVLYMPAVSVVVSGDQMFENPSAKYAYATIPFQKPSLWVRMLTTFTGALTFVIAVFLFAIPVTVTSLILISSLNSPVGPANQNQDVPGIEKVVPYQQTAESKVKPLR